MKESEIKLTRKISPYKIIYPILIGLAVVSYMLYKEFDITAFRQITFTWTSVWWILAAILCMVVRDLGYTIQGTVKLDEIHPDYLPLGIYFGSNPIGHRRDKPGYFICKQRRHKSRKKLSHGYGNFFS